MSTRSSTRNLFPPLDNLELTIRRSPRVDPTLLKIFEMATNENGDDVLPPGGGDLPVLDLQTMEELCQPTLNGRGGPIAPISIQATNFELKNNMIQQDTFVQRSELSSSITSSSDPEIVALKAEMVKIYKNLMKPPLAKLRTYILREPIIKVMNTASSLSLGTLPSNNITNLKEDLKGITTRSGNAYQGPTIPTTSSSPKVVERETEVTKDTVPPTNNGSIKDVQPLVVQIKTLVPNSESVVELVFAPVSAPKPNPKSSIPYPSRLHDQKLRDKTNDQKDKFFKIFQDLDFNISFADALILMPNFGLTIKSLFTNKEKLFELARTPLNEHSSAILLKKLPKKLGDPGKFLTSCDLPGMDECLALADLDASLNLMPLSMWNKLSLPKLSPTCMTLELANHSISRPIGVAIDVFVKVGTFHFMADFVVVDFDANPQVPLIIRRSFLKTRRALIDVHKGELTLRIGKEAVTFDLDQTSRYSANYDAMSVNRIDLIDVACEEYSQEVLGFSMSGNPTPSTEPIGDILFLEEFLNDDPSSPPLPPQELKVVKPTNEKSSINEPPMVELKDLPPHLEYAFLEGDDKLPVIIAKDLKDEEKTTLIKILMEDDFKLALQHQRRVNPKIYEVIKKEVLKLLDSRLIYPISDSPWVSPMHCVPKKGGFTVVENEENELIPTRLVTGWRVCIDYRKLNDATRKDHFPLPFMNQMLERLAGNQYYCFLDDKMLKRCEDTNFCLNWEKSHFMVKKGIILGHKISKNGIKVDKAKVDIIAKLPHPTTVKGIHSFLGYVGFYRQSIQDFSKIGRPMTHLLEKDTMFFFSKECIEAFQTFKKRLTEAPILVSPDWDLPFELMCDASDFAIEKTKRIHDSKIKDHVFNVGDRVLLFNSRLNIFSGKLKTRWTGPFTITQVFPYGTVELSQIDGPNFKVNGHRLKHYFGGDIPKMVVLDLQTFAKDQ
nr:reverse transcriptase domain-containing protein [Tanacetum cinerariifolium]